MDKLIHLIETHFPTVKKKGIRVSLIYLGVQYVTISVQDDKIINLMDKFIYESSKGKYIRALFKPERYVRIYLEEFENEN